MSILTRGALTAILLLALAPAARGATLTGTFAPGGPGKSQTPYYAIGYDAASGEHNDLDLRLDGDTLVARDASAPLAAAGLCAQVDLHTATCPRRVDASGPVTGLISVALGDGDDRLTVAPDLGFAPQRGGDGDDVLSGGFLEGAAGDDTLEGTAGRGFLVPGPGTDTVRAGDGDDLVPAGDDGVPDADRLDGGGGTDTVSFSGSVEVAEAVTVDLLAGVSRGPSQGSTRSPGSRTPRAEAARTC